MIRKWPAKSAQQAVQGFVKFLQWPQTIEFAFTTQTQSRWQQTVSWLALLMSRTPDSTRDGIDHSRKGSNIPKLALYCGDHSLTDRRNLFHNAACKRDWRQPFMIASHTLQSSHNELREICQCLSLLMQYLSRNLVSQ